MTNTPTPQRNEPTAFTTEFGRIRAAQYQSPSWCKNRHIQTIWGRYAIKRAPIAWDFSEFVTADDDVLHIAWAPRPPRVEGVVVLFHGLEGSVESHYIQDMVAGFVGLPLQVVVMHFRGCWQGPNRQHRAYHSGETSDAQAFTAHLQTLYPNLPLYAVGFSLGGNMLLKLAGETKQDNPFKACVSISAPMRLEQCAKAISRGFSQVYEQKLLRSMRANLRQKMATMDYSGRIRVSAAGVGNLSTFYKFDENVTAPLHGFAGADDYYQKASAMGFLKHITTPTLVIHALDDPFMNAAVVPKPTGLSAHVAYELSRRGGHVGFLEGMPWNTTSWLPRRVPDFIAQQHRVHSA